MSDQSEIHDAMKALGCDLSGETLLEAATRCASERDLLRADKIALRARVSELEEMYALALKTMVPKTRVSELEGALWAIAGHVRDDWAEIVAREALERSESQ